MKQRRIHRRRRAAREGKQESRDRTIDELASRDDELARLDELIDEILAQGTEQSLSFFWSRRPHTCPKCEGKFSHAKVVDEGHENFLLHCPICNANLGRIERERLQVTADKISGQRGDPEGEKVKR